jgi:excinuclease ABC subunit C
MSATTSIRKRVTSPSGAAPAASDHRRVGSSTSSSRRLRPRRCWRAAVHQAPSKFNIRLRDDKSYPYIGVSLDEDYPRVYFTREKHRSGRAYFGPFSSAKRVRETLDLLGKLFQFRTCEGTEPGRRSGSPCLDYYIKRCGAPCVGYVSQEEYRRNIEAIVDFLSGRYRQVEAEQQEKMEAAAGAEEFERAALHRDRLKAIRSLFERQRVAGGSEPPI